MPKQNKSHHRLFQMEMKYFFITMGSYIGIFLLGWLLEELIFTIFECHPLIRYIGLLVWMITDIWITNKVINQKNADAFLRKEPEDLGEKEAAEAIAALDKKQEKRKLFKKKETVEEEPVPLPAIDQRVVKELQSGKWETAFEDQETADFDFSAANIVPKAEVSEQKPVKEEDPEPQETHAQTAKPIPLAKPKEEKKEATTSKQPFGLPAEDISSKWMTPFDEIETGDIHVVIEKDE